MVALLVIKVVVACTLGIIPIAHAFHIQIWIHGRVLLHFMRILHLSLRRQVLAIPNTMMNLLPIYRTPYAQQQATNNETCKDDGTYQEKPFKIALFLNPNH